METRNAPKKPSRFQIVKLEERIAPAALALAFATAFGPNIANTATVTRAYDYGTGGNYAYSYSGSYAI